MIVNKCCSNLSQKFGKSEETAETSMEKNWSRVHSCHLQQCWGSFWSCSQGCWWTHQIKCWTLKVELEKINVIHLSLLHWSKTCQRILWVFVSRLLCENGWRYIEYKSMFLYNFLWPKKKEKTDFFLTPAVWPQIAAQSVSLLIDTLYIPCAITHCFGPLWSKCSESTVAISITLVASL